MWDPKPKSGENPDAEKLKYNGKKIKGAILKRLDLERERELTSAMRRGWRGKQREHDPWRRRTPFLFSLSSSRSLCCWRERECESQREREREENMKSRSVVLHDTLLNLTNGKEPNYVCFFLENQIMCFFIKRIRWDSNSNFYILG